MKARLGLKMSSAKWRHFGYRISIPAYSCEANQPQSGVMA